MEEGLMDFGEFKKEVCAALNKRLGGSVLVKEVTIDKNNGVEFDGLKFEELQKNLAPILYLETVYEEYKNGRDMERILDELEEAYRENQNPEGIDVSDIIQWKYAERRMEMRLVNYNMNKERLSEEPYIRFLDLAVTFYIGVENGKGSVFLDDRLLKKYRKTVWEVYDAAVKNLETPVVLTLSDVAKELEKEKRIQEEDLKLAQDDDMELYVMTNNSMMFGAVGMMNKEFIKSILEEKEVRNCYIIPSSVHEVLLVPEKEETDIEELRSLVRKVNNAFVLKEDILSYNVYLYDSEKDEITIV